VSDEKKNPLRELEPPEIRSKNILFVRGNKSQSGAVWKIAQAKIL
jgi:hypothetical protein